MTDADPHLTIAQHLVQAAPTGWQKLWTEGKVGEGYSDLLFAYASAEKDRNYFVPSYEDNEVIHAELVKLRDRMQQEGKEKWSHFTFTLQPDGKFNLHVDYDD
ncbi:immunity protein YezG family protein [Sphingobium aromaticiconvertens]|uniref:immunity protein YezG family protein n=1 Tax=Sphingobium aromaticiconvertens TaxID=365341 RepID=UPI003017A0D8